MKYISLIWRMLIDIAMACVVLVLLVTVEGRFESYTIGFLGLIYYSIYGIFLKMVYSQELFRYLVAHDVHHLKILILKRKTLADAVDKLNHGNRKTSLGEFSGGTEEDLLRYKEDEMMQFEKKLQFDEVTLGLRSSLMFIAAAGCMIKIITTIISI